jgi:hypothetical protein
MGKYIALETCIDIRGRWKTFGGYTYLSRWVYLGWIYSARLIYIARLIQTQSQNLVRGEGMRIHAAKVKGRPWSKGWEGAG